MRRLACVLHEEHTAQFPAAENVVLRWDVGQEIPRAVPWINDQKTAVRVEHEISRRDQIRVVPDPAVSQIDDGDVRTVRATSPSHDGAVASEVHALHFYGGSNLRAVLASHRITAKIDVRRSDRFNGNFVVCEPRVTRKYRRLDAEAEQNS